MFSCKHGIIHKLENTSFWLATEAVSKFVKERKDKEGDVNEIIKMKRLGCEKALYVRLRSFNSILYTVEGH